MRNTSNIHYVVRLSRISLQLDHFRTLRTIYLLHERTYRKSKNYINVNLCDVMELQ